MFVQVIQGRTSNEEGLRAASDRWMEELASGATGWLGSTLGVTDDGRAIAVVRFESASAAQANAQRPEQTRWWEETSALFDGEVTFLDSEEVMVDVVGDPDRAGFVQVMQGQVTDPARAKELMGSITSEDSAAFRPDILGSMSVGHDDGRWTQVIYFTSEAEAREGERKEAPPEFQAVMEEMGKISVGPPDYVDLRRPVLESPR
jgi:hypothetical protein